MISNFIKLRYLREVYVLIMLFQRMQMGGKQFSEEGVPRSVLPQHREMGQANSKHLLQVGISQTKNQKTVIIETGQDRVNQSPNQTETLHQIKLIGPVKNKIMVKVKCRGHCRTVM